MTDDEARELLIRLCNALHDDDFLAFVERLDPGLAKTLDRLRDRLYRALEKST